MSSGTITTTPPPPETPPPRGRADREAFIEDRLRKTRRQVKGVDIAVGLMSLAVGALVYLLVAAIIDHWLITGGLGFWGRLLLMLGLLGAVGCYFSFRILPLLLHRINPVFAAYTIEQCRPSLKNSLVNFLLLRRRADEVPRVVYGALEDRAAVDLSKVPVDSVVDRSNVIRLGYLLVGVLAVCCLYLLLSPKNPFVSFGRVIWPWANIAAPTRVTIEDVRARVGVLGDQRGVGKTGDLKAFHGQSVVVSAKIKGVEDGEQANLYYTTADGQSVDQAVPIGQREDGGLHTCELPPGDRGLQQNLTYYLAAGDCVTRTFNIEVQSSPTILVRRVDYRYPTYTGIAERSVEDQGDVRAIEGTVVTIHATANHQIDRAEIDLDCDGRQGLKMKVDDKTAVGRFTLRLDRADPGRPEHDCYQLRLVDLDGRRDRRPIRYEIDIIRDLPPDVQLVDPPARHVELPVDGTLELKVRAEDPDFALRRVALRAERDEKGLLIKPLLKKLRSQTALAEPFEGAYRFVPAQLELNVGDEVIYWAEAEDNKEPVPNRSETGRYSITIVAGDGRQSPRQQPQDGGRDAQREQPQEKDQPGDRQPDPGDEQPQDQPDEKQPDRGQEPAEDQPTEDQPQGQDQESSEQARPGQGGEGSKSHKDSGQTKSADAGQQQDPQEGETSEEPGEPIDGEANPGDVIEEVLKHRQEQQRKDARQQDQQQPDQQQPGQQKPGQPQPGEQQPDKEQPGEPRPGEEQPGKQQSGEQQPGQKQPGQEPSGEQQPGQEQPGQEQPGEGQSGEQQPGQQQSRGKSDSSGDNQGKQPSVAEDSQAGREGSKSEEQPKEGDGAQAKSSDDGSPQDQPPRQGKGRPDAQGGDREGKKGEAGAGKKSDSDAGSPSPQEAAEPRRKKPGQDGQAQSKKDEPATSPGGSKKESDSQGEEAGDRSGGGEDGGGQRSKQPGAGTGGSRTAADQGDSQAGQPGEGAAGEKAGDREKADRPTGKTAPNEAGPGGRREPGTDGAGDGQKGRPQDQMDPTGGRPTDSDQPGARQTDAEDPREPNARGSGNPTRGGKPGEQAGPPPQPDGGEPGGDAYNKEFSEEATDLALEYLRDQLAKEEPDQDLLDRLGGWTREDLEKFTRRWDRMRREAVGQSPRARAAQKDLEQAIKSLGLRPGGTELRGGQSTPDDVGTLRDSPRFAPPAEWADQVREYLKGTAAGER